MKMKRFLKWYYIVPAALVLVPVFIALFVTVVGGIVMLLWNWLLPSLFGWPEITLLQAFGLVALTRILFGGFGGGGGGGDRFEKHMTPEDKERFRQRMNKRFCSTAPDGEESAPTIDTTVVPPRSE